MMIGHLTFLGFAEFIVSAGVVQYVQQIDPSLLRATAPDVPTGTKYPGTFQKNRMLVLRAETAATLLVLLVLSTHWNHLLPALRFFRVPAVIVVILEMTQRYVFLLLETTRDMLESR